MLRNLPHILSSTPPMKLLDRSTTKKNTGMVPLLPIEMLTAILIRLPVKALLRFRCVSKAWCELIKSPEFRSLYNNNKHNRKQIQILIKRCEEEFVDDKDFTKPPTYKNKLSFYPNPSNTGDLGSRAAPDMELPTSGKPRTMLAGSINGIVCIVDKSDYYYSPYCRNPAAHPDVYLCNPGTREIKMIPSFPFLCPDGLRRKCLTYGFAHDPNTNDYTVAMFIEDCEDLGYSYGDLLSSVAIYRSSTNSWRQVELPQTPALRGCVSNGLAFQGYLNWPQVSDRILAFHIATEAFREIEYPPYNEVFAGAGYPRNSSRERNSYLWYHVLDILGESMAFITWNGVYNSDKRYRDEDKWIEVWVMKEYGVRESWTKKFLIGPLSRIACPLCLWKRQEEEEELMLLLETVDGQLIGIDNEKLQLSYAPFNPVNLRRLELELRKYDVRGHSLRGYPATSFASSLGVVFYQESLISVSDIVL